MRIKKTVLIILILFLTVAAAAQKKDTIPPKPELPVPDTVMLVTNKQINEVLAVMRKNISVEEIAIYNILVQELQKAVNEGVIRYRKRKN